MKCAWDLLLKILPKWMRADVDMHGRQTLQELRLRRDKPPELITSKGDLYLGQLVSDEDIRFCINTATQYSPWAAQSVRSGYITAPGGHRIGLCGQAVMEDGQLQGLQSVHSLCLRVARDFEGIAVGTESLSGSVLIIGPPGAGKTTLLRDMIRLRSNSTNGTIGVVDEKGEIFPLDGQAYAFEIGSHTDVITGCIKSQGIDALLRNMGPRTIAVDEITAAADCDALISAAWCGVDLFATAHATDRQDLMNRSVYRPIVENRIFHHLIVLRRDKSWSKERMFI